MEAVKTESLKKDVSWKVLSASASCGVWVGDKVAELCNFFMDFTVGQEKAMSAACMLAFGIIGLVVGVWLDNKINLK